MNKAAVSVITLIVSRCPKNIGSGKTLQNFCTVEFTHYVTHLIDVSNRLLSMLTLINNVHTNTTTELGLCFPLK